MKRVTNRIPTWAAGSVLASALYLLSFVAPAAATQQGLDLGPLVLYPAIDFSAEYDSNVLRRPMVVHDDFIFSVTPGLKVWLPLGPFFVRGDGSYSINRYQEYTNQDNEQFKLGLATGLNLSILDFTVGDTYTRTYLPSQAAYEVAEYLDTNQYYAKLGLNLGRRVFIDLEYFNYDFSYQETEDLDREESTLNATLQIGVTQNVKVLADIGYSALEYNAATYEYSPDSPLWQDNEMTQYRGGVIWAFTALTTGEIRVGVATKTYQEDIIEPATEWVGVGKMSTAFGTRTFLDFDFRRSMIESDYQYNPYYMQNLAELTLSRRLGSRMTARAGFNYQQDDFPIETNENIPFEEEYLAVDKQIAGQDADTGIVTEDLTNDPNLSLPYQTAKRKDTYWGFKLGLDWQLFRWLGLDIEYRYSDCNSNLDRFDYEYHQVSLTGQLRI